MRWRGGRRPPHKKGGALQKEHLQRALLAFWGIFQIRLRENQSIVMVWPSGRWALRLGSVTVSTPLL